MRLGDLIRRCGIPCAPDGKAPTAERLGALVAAHSARGGRVLDLGCGARRMDGVVARLDYAGSAACNLLGDAQRLPFPDGVFSLVVCTAVLEHVRDFRRAIAEIARVLQPGGEVWVEVPWVFPLHACDPAEHEDYIRFSPYAYETEFAQFERLAFGPALGPGSGVAQILARYIALFFSMRNHTGLYHNVHNLCTWLLYPLRWTDRLIQRRRYNEKIAAGFYFHGSKMPVTPTPR